MCTTNFFHVVAQPGYPLINIMYSTRFYTCVALRILLLPYYPHYIPTTAGRLRSPDFLRICAALRYSIVMFIFWNAVAGRISNMT